MGYYPHELRVDPALCRGQFMLTGRPELIPSGWETRASGRWTLGYARPLVCAPIRRGEVVLGWVVGHAVDESVGLLDESDGIRLPSGETPAALADRLIGRFVLLDLSGDAPRAHQDIYGMLAAVFAPEEDTLASTGLLIPPSSRTPYDVDRIIATDIPYRSAMYPVGLTPRRGMERLLPNHVLDLGNWQQTRTWPVSGIVQNADPAPVTARTARIVRRTMEAVRDRIPLQIPLTAGLDSRLLLACGRDLLDGTLFFTADLGDEGGWQDVAAARRIADRFGLHHRVFPWRTARRRDLHAWAVRTGGETGEIRGWRSCRTLGMQEPGRASMTGFLGELARAYWWQRFDERTVVTPEFILGRCGVGRRREFVERAEWWLAGLPPLNGIAAVEVLYLEQRGACWAGVVEYGELGDSALRLPPLGQADLVRDLLTLPDDYRRGRRVHLDIIQAAWPELLEIPFNEDWIVPPSRQRLYRARRRFRQSTFEWGRIWRKVRQPGWLVRRLGLSRRPAARGEEVGTFRGEKEKPQSEP